MVAGSLAGAWCHKNAAVCFKQDVQAVHRAGGGEIADSVSNDRGISVLSDSSRAGP